jgi:hypothetical protein
VQHYFDNVQDQFGNAVGGVAVLVKIGGVSATIYSDNGINAKTNPLTAASNGAFDFYAANGTYTLTVTHPDGTTSDSFATLFDVNDVNATAIGFSQLAASTGSSLVGFVQSGTGAVATTVQGELRKLAPAPVAVSASRNIGADDQGAVLVCSQAVTLTIPAGLASGFSLAVEQSGTGQVTVAAGAGVTLRNVDSQFKTSSQFAIIGLMNVGSDTYNLSGSTSA